MRYAKYITNGPMYAENEEFHICVTYSSGRGRLILVESGSSRANLVCDLKNIPPPPRVRINKSNLPFYDIY